VKLHAFEIARFGPGETIAATSKGDFVLTRGDAWTSQAIRLGEYLKFWGEARKYAYWNHAALFVGENGELVEALGRGVTRSNVSKYKPVTYHVVQLAGVSQEDREHAADFAFHCAEIHQTYGYLTILSIALSLLFGGRLGFGIDGQEICSGLVGRALERTGEIFDVEPWHMMPADLAKAYRVDPPV